MRWGTVDKYLANVSFTNLHEMEAAFKEMTELMQDTRVSDSIRRVNLDAIGHCRVSEINSYLMDAIGQCHGSSENPIIMRKIFIKPCSFNFNDPQVHFQAIQGTKVLKFMCMTRVLDDGTLVFSNLLSNLHFSISFVTIVAILSHQSLSLKDLFVTDYMVETHGRLEKVHNTVIHMYKGILDRRFCFVTFPNLDSLKQALKEMTHMMAHFVWHFACMYEGTAQKPYPQRIFYDARSQKICLIIGDREDRHIGELKYSKVHQNVDGSVFFSNTMNPQIDPEEDYPNRSSISYASIMIFLHRFTFAGQKPDLFTFLMGVNKPMSSVFRFFKHPLCERQVLRFVQQF